METKHTVSRVCKVLFILFLIISVLTSVVYFSVTSSLTTAEEDNEIPQIFGREYVPMMKTGLFDTIQPGSIVLIEDTFANQVKPGTVLLYNTPADNNANEVFSGLSLATVQSMDQAEEGGAVTFYVKDGNGTELQTVSAESIHGKGVYALNGMGKVMQFVNSTAGLVVFIIVPVFIFVASLVLFLVLRPRKNEYYDKEEFELEIKADEKTEDIKTENPLFDTDIKSRTLSSSMAQDMSSLRSAQLSEDLFEDNVRSEGSESENDDVIALMSQSDSILVDDMQQEEREDEVDQLLKDLETSNVKSNDHTMEFDLAKLQEQILNDTSSEQSNEILSDLDKQIAELKDPQDSIKFLLQENSIDVNFRNIISMDIEIENHADGSGFTVKTPNYNASITISISKNK